MTARDLLNLVQSGAHPVVTFGKRISYLEGYADPGMRARIVAAKAVEEDVLELSFDYGEFEDYNRQFEKADYFDRYGVARLTARESGKYPQNGIERFYLALDIETVYEDVKLPEILTIEDTESLALLTEFQQSGSEATYVQWLEKQLLAARSAS